MEFLHRPEIFLESGSIKNYFDLSQSYDIINKTIKRFVDEGLLVNPKELEFKPGDRVDNCEVVNIIAGGVIVEFGLRSVGFVHRYYFSGYETFLEGLDNGDLLTCEVIEYRIEHSKYNLKFIPRS